MGLSVHLAPVPSLRGLDGASAPAPIGVTPHMSEIYQGLGFEPETAAP
jgi:hypothetical protein